MPNTLLNRHKSADFLHRSQQLLSQDLINAYLHTHYKVSTNPPFSLIIGQLCVELAHIFSTTEQKTAAFISAWNPCSFMLNNELNSLRHKQLLTDISALGYIGIEGWGEATDNDYDGEQSVFILGISAKEAIDLGQQYEQNAIVFCHQQAIPELVILR